MALDADCVVSTVLETVRVTSKFWSPVPGEFWEGRMTHSSRSAAVASMPNQKNSGLSSVLSVPLWFFGG